MSTQQYSLHIHDDFRIEMVRFSRPENSNELTLQADYRLKGVDSRNSASSVQTLTNTFSDVFTETSPLAQFDEAVQDALIVLNGYIESKLLEIHFP